VEGAGGLLVPLHRELRETWVDFLQATGLPVVIVARTALGTINHSLLTVQVLRAAEIPIAGLLFCGKENADNRRTIREFARADDLGRFYLEGASDLETAQVDLAPLLRML
jgi:dethiobiotin synthetase